MFVRMELRDSDKAIFETCDKKERDFIELKIKPSGSNDLISFYKNASVFLQHTALALCVLY
jgi:hypothetical protein